MMECPYNFERSYQEWSRIPIDDFDYMSADELGYLHPLQRRELLEMVIGRRYSQSQWRNLDNCLINFMRPDLMAGKVVMDYGCGIGLDSSQFAVYGAKVFLADIHPKLLQVAQQMLITITGMSPHRLIISYPHPPWFISPNFDLFWSLGVLHHTPHIRGILERACQLLNPEGLCKICLYSDKRWKNMTGEKLPQEEIWKHPKFEEFTKKCDSVGNYADAYDMEKIKRIVEGFGEVIDCRYLSDDQFIGATIKPLKESI